MRTLLQPHPPRATYRARWTVGSIHEEGALSAYAALQLLRDYQHRGATAGVGRNRDLRPESHCWGDPAGRRG